MLVNSVTYLQHIGVVQNPGQPIWHSIHFASQKVVDVAMRGCWGHSRVFKVQLHGRNGSNMTLAQPVPIAIVGLVLRIECEKHGLAKSCVCSQNFVEEH